MSRYDPTELDRLHAAVQDRAKFTAIGEARSDSKLEPAALAALTVTCQAILNLDATIYER